MAISQNQINQIIERKELIKRYSETFVRAKPATNKEAKWEPVMFVNGSLDDKGEIVVQLQSLLSRSKYFGGGNGKTYSWSSVELDLSLPRSGVYFCDHYGDFPCLLTRSATRQWKWGMCRGNMNVTNIFSSGHIFREMYGFLGKNFILNPKNEKAGYLQFGEIGFDSSIARQILSFEPTEYSEAIAEIAAGKKALSVIDNDYFISVHPQHGGILLWRWDTPLGIILNPSSEGGNVRIKVISELFAQEVRDFYSRRGIYNVDLQRS